MVQRVFCVFGRHAPNRRKAWHDSQNMRSKCLGCGSPMLRDLAGWRPFESSDNSVHRDPHPRYDQC